MAWPIDHGLSVYPVTVVWIIWMIRIPSFITANYLIIIKEINIMIKNNGW